MRRDEAISQLEYLIGLSCCPAECGLIYIQHYKETLEQALKALKNEEEYTDDCK